VASKTEKSITIKDKATHQSIDYDARACFAKSAKIFTDAEISGEQARTLREWAKYEFRMGNEEQAAKMWQEAKDIFARLGAEMEVRRMDQLPE
jgi:hypothetical protein